MYIFDTETLGFQGDTVLIQYCTLENPTEIILWEIFKNPVIDTLRLIEDMMSKGVIGFNLSFDIFHLAQTYNILRLYPNKDEIPRVSTYYETLDKYSNDEVSPNIYEICLKPSKCFDLMLHGRESFLQVTMNQKPVYVRKFPRVLAKHVLKYLEKMPMQPLVKGEWQIKEIDEDGNEINNRNVEPHPSLVNIRFIYKSSGTLKAIAKELLHRKDVLTYETYTKVDEYGYYPIGGNYREHLRDEIHKWHTDTRQRTYAEDDVKNTRDLLAWCYLHQLENYTPKEELDLHEVCTALHRHSIEELYAYGTGTTNHTLVALVANTYWSGYSIDKPLVKKRLLEYREKQLKNKAVLNYNSPKQALEYLHELCDEIELAIITKTNKETLEELINNFEEYSEGLGLRAEFVYNARRLDKKVITLERLNHAGRLHCAYKVLGTKSNRMAGGGAGGKGGSINPQGLGHTKDIRELITFTDKSDSTYTLSKLEGGDFSGFEVSIMEAIYQDPELQKTLKEGKKFHALWGMSLYDMSYEEILSPENEELYHKAKTSVFAEAYGADVKKLAEVTGLSPEEVELAKEKFQQQYQGIGEAKRKVKESYTCIRSDPKSKRLYWVEPQRYAESLLGFRRYYEQEYGTIKFLFDLAINLPEDEFDLSLEFLRKKDGYVQSCLQACRSALLSGAFSLMSGIIRASGNHQIQSVGGEMTKKLQENFWELQPTGCTHFKLKPMNVHDEVDIPMIPELSEKVKKIKEDFVEEYKSLIPLLKIDWKQGDNWYDIH